MIFLQAIRDESDRRRVEDIYIQYRSTMLYVAQNVLHDKFLAEDAVSQAMINIIDNMEKIQFENCNKTRGLVVIIVRNISINMLRNMKGKEMLLIEDFENTIADTEDTPSEHILSEESYHLIMQCLSELNDTYKDILRLKFVYDYTDLEIARVLGISEGNVRVRLHRAKQALHKELGKEGIYHE